LNRTNACTRGKQRAQCKKNDNQSYNRAHAHKRRDYTASCERVGQNTQNIYESWDIVMIHKWDKIEV